MKLSDLTGLGSLFGGLTEANRPLRLRLSSPDGTLDDVLLLKRVTGTEQLCGGIDYKLLYVSQQAGIPIKNFIALPVEIQLVTDTGKLRSICGIVAQAFEGESDGGFATYQLIVRDALSLMDLGSTSRIFLNKSEIEITQTVLDEWRQSNPIAARAFEVDYSKLAGDFPKRAFTMQCNESNGQFLKRLWKRRGIAWFISAGQSSQSSGDDTPAHTLVFFNDPYALDENAAGTIRYHRADGTEQRDCVTAWMVARTLVAGSVTRQSWDYKQTRMAQMQEESGIDQGQTGNDFAGGLDDHQIDAPHIGNDAQDYADLGQLRMQRHEYNSKCFYAESDVRDLCIGQYNSLTDHPEIDSHPAEERQFILTELHIDAENNLPKDIEAKTGRLFDANRWNEGKADWQQQDVASVGETGMRYRNHFTCVRRGIPIVPGYDPTTDAPRAHPMSAIVVAPDGEEIHTDEQGRIKIRFLGMRLDEHDHAQGAGTTDTDQDSAWVRLTSQSSSKQWGMITLPRAGDEVIVNFLNGDCDKPIIVGSVHNGSAPPPTFSHQGSLPGNKVLSGIKSKEIKGRRANQLRFDDSTGQISAQLASDHAQSQLNLGFLTHPRQSGKAEARGEGAELRTDDSMAVRTAKGLLVTAWDLNSQDTQLARDETLALMEQCLELFKSSGKAASEHQANAQDNQLQEQLHTDVKQWGSNGKNSGNAAVIAISAPNGISYASAQTIVTTATVNIDSIAQQHMQLTAKERFNINAGKGISQFAHKDGIKHIAHKGKMLIQSQHDDTDINAAKNVTITATETTIKMMAKEIHIIAEDGSFVKIGGGITIGSNGEIMHKGAEFPFDGPATMSTKMPAFSGELPKARTPRPAPLKPTYSQQLDALQFIGLDAESGVAYVPVPYSVRDTKGNVIHEGTTNDSGETQRFYTEEAEDVSLYLGEGEWRIFAEVASPFSPDAGDASHTDKEGETK